MATSAGSRAAPLLVVTGTVGIGKSTLCARLAGTIPGVVLLPDADIFAEDLVSVAPPNDDYEAFWRSMMGASLHQLARNKVSVVYFSVMRPEQVLANSDILDYFQSVKFSVLDLSGPCPARTTRPPRTPCRLRWVREVGRFQRCLGSGCERTSDGRRRGRRSRNRAGRA